MTYFFQKLWGEGAVPQVVIGATALAFTENELLHKYEPNFLRDLLMIASAATFKVVLYISTYPNQHSFR